MLHIYIESATYIYRECQKTLILTVQKGILSRSEYIIYEIFSRVSKAN
nr:MAG TPA: hypothetical protein [Caudoviricetes sp.]